MVRTALYSFTGGGVDFILAFVAVSIMAGTQPTSNTAGITLLLGSLLAGLGAVAGALIGGVADLLEYFRTRDEAARSVRAQRESETA